MAMKAGDAVLVDEKRDLDHIAASVWPRGVFPVPAYSRREPVSIIIRRSVLEAIHTHGLSRTDIEVCGVMVGDVYQDAEGVFVHVEACIRGDHAGSQAAQVTFTAETWNHIHSVLDRAFPEKRILGWYHTHPGFGIFLSPMDVFIHDNFFQAAEQLAFVYDPLQATEGLFVWRKGKPHLGSFLIEEDVDGIRKTNADVPEDAPSTPATVGLREVCDRLDRLEQRLKGFRLRFWSLAIIALIWPALLVAAMWLPPVQTFFRDFTVPLRQPSPADRSKHVNPQPVSAPPRVPTQGQVRIKGKDNEADKVGERSGNAADITNAETVETKKDN